MHFHATDHSLLKMRAQDALNLNVSLIDLRAPTSANGQDPCVTKYFTCRLWEAQSAQEPGPSVRGILWVWLHALQMLGENVMGTVVELGKQLRAQAAQPLPAGDAEGSVFLDILGAKMVSPPCRIFPWQTQLLQHPLRPDTCSKLLRQSDIR